VTVSTMVPVTTRVPVTTMVTPVTVVVAPVSTVMMQPESGLMEPADHVCVHRLPGRRSRWWACRAWGGRCGRAGPAHALGDLAGQRGVITVGGCERHPAQPTLEHGHHLAAPGGHPYRPARLEWARENAGPGGLRPRALDHWPPIS
jgi:hypothetical protein